MTETNCAIASHCKLPEKILEHWTQSAIYCYKIKSDCEKCKIISGLESLKSYECRMRKVIEILEKRNGKPQGGICNVY